MRLEATFPQGRAPEIGFRPAYIGEGAKPRLLAPDDEHFGNVLQLLRRASVRFGVGFVRVGDILKPVEL